MIVKRRTRGTNGIRPARLAEVSFRLHYAQTQRQSRCQIYTTTWDYTTLKHGKLPAIQTGGFTTTWDCTTLKRALRMMSRTGCFTTTWDYTTLKPQTSNFKTAGISFGKMGKLAVFLRFGAALRHYNRVSGGSKTIIAHESKFAKVFVDDPHLLTRSDRLFLSALQQENGQFFIKHRLIKKRYFILRKE